ncbi:MAG: glycosyltransferase family 2 protein [Candidatus Diapherotrites archaeon]
MQVSVVLPVYNEEENIFLLISEIEETLKKRFKSFEIIAVDDGSTDGSLSALLQMKKKYKNLKIVKLKKNFGQSAALDAGFGLAKGEVIVPMDSDLQNDPNDIFKLVQKAKDFDVVCGWRYTRRDSFSKKIFSTIARFIEQRSTGLTIHDSGCTLKAIRREVVQKISLYSETHRFIPALAQNFGFTVTEEKVNHRERKFGKTKYNVKRLFKGLMDLSFINFWNNFSNRPLHFFGFFGLGSIVLGFVIAAYKIFYQFLYEGLPLEAGPLLLLSILLVILGAMFLMMGFLAEIMIRSYYQSSNSKPYLVEKVY